MEIEDKIIREISNMFQEKEVFDNDKIKQINKLIIYQSVKALEGDKTDRDAINFIENKLYDLFTK